MDLLSKFSREISEHLYEEDGYISAASVPGDLALLDVLVEDGSKREGWFSKSHPVLRNCGSMLDVGIFKFKEDADFADIIRAEFLRFHGRGEDDCNGEVPTRPKHFAWTRDLDMNFRISKPSGSNWIAWGSKINSVKKEVFHLQLGGIRNAHLENVYGLYTMEWKPMVEKLWPKTSNTKIIPLFMRPHKKLWIVTDILYASSISWSRYPSTEQHAIGLRAPYAESRAFGKNIVHDLHQPVSSDSESERLAYQGPDIVIGFRANILYFNDEDRLVDIHYDWQDWPIRPIYAGRVVNYHGTGPGELEISQLLDIDQLASTSNVATVDTSMKTSSASTGSQILSPLSKMLPSSTSQPSISSTGPPRPNLFELQPSSTSQPSISSAGPPRPNLFKLQPSSTSQPSISSARPPRPNLFELQPSSTSQPSISSVGPPRPNLFELQPSTRLGGYIGWMPLANFVAIIILALALFIYLPNCTQILTSHGMIVASSLERLIISFVRSSVWTLLLWYGFSHIQDGRTTAKYYFWYFFAIVFRDRLSAQFGDYAREYVRGLAPCNYFHGVVKPSIPRTTYVAKSSHQGQRLDTPLPTRLFSSKILDSHSFENIIFGIGEGQVVVERIDEEQFHFKCIARGRTMEEFGAIADYNSMNRVTTILEYWEKNSDVGVIENMIHRKERIYCHCLDLRTIVEGIIFTSIDYFSFFELNKPCRFLVGSIPENESGRSMIFYIYFSIVTVIGTYYQLKSSNELAVWLVILTVIGLIVVIMMGLVDDIMIKVICYEMCRIFGKKGREKLYRWMKRNDMSLAFSDDFNPMLRERGEKELLLLRPSTTGGLNASRTTQLDWKSLNIVLREHLVPPNTHANARLNSLVMMDTQAAIASGWGKEVIEVCGKFGPNPQKPFRSFKLELPCGRFLHAKSNYVDGQATPSNILLTSTDVNPVNLEPSKLETMIRFSDEEESRLYEWTESNYFLFVYILIKWKKTTFGAVKHFKTPSFSRRYIEVRGTFELADLIKSGKLTAYHILPKEDCKPKDTMA